MSEAAHAASGGPRDRHAERDRLWAGVVAARERTDAARERLHRLVEAQRPERERIARERAVLALRRERLARQRELCFLGLCVSFAAPPAALLLAAAAGAVLGW